MSIGFIEPETILCWCKERGIRVSGPPLGRPPKNVSKEQKRQDREDEGIRNLH